jgi:type IV fimbrial biogenesis protein FimT
MIVNRKLRAFTLVELLVTLSVAAILVAMAAPSFSEFIKNNRLTTQINAFTMALNVARSEAIKRSAEVVLCASEDEATCSGTWSDGWVVFADTDEDQTVDNNETVILVNGTLPNNMVLNRNITSNNVVFESDGYANAGEASSFVLCDDRGKDYAKGIAVNTAGRVRLLEAADIANCL